MLASLAISLALANSPHFTSSLAKNDQDSWMRMDSITLTSNAVSAENWAFSSLNEISSLSYLIFSNYTFFSSSDSMYFLASILSIILFPSFFNDKFKSSLLLCNWWVYSSIWLPITLDAKTSISKIIGRDWILKYWLSKISTIFLKCKYVSSGF